MTFLLSNQGANSKGECLYHDEDGNMSVIHHVKVKKWLWDRHKVLGLEIKEVTLDQNDFGIHHPMLHWALMKVI